MKKFLVLVLSFVATCVFAAVDINKANQAEIESIKGIGPGLAQKILAERKKSEFKNWQDLIDRVGGVGDANAAKFSKEGLTVNGTPLASAAAPKEKEKISKKEVAKTTGVAPTPAPASMPASVNEAKKTDKKSEKKAQDKAEKAKASDAK